MNATGRRPKPFLPALASLNGKTENIALPLIRVTAGALLMPHGAQKLFGWFGGGGLDAAAEAFSTHLGLEPGLLWALLAGLIEFFGGLFLALGLLTRPVAAAILVLMAVAVFYVHLGNGFFWGEGGFEYPLMWGLVALAFLLHGGGALSVDAAIGREF